MSYHSSSDRDGRYDDYRSSNRSLQNFSSSDQYRRSSLPRRPTPPHDPTRSTPRGPVSDRERGSDRSSGRGPDSSRDHYEGRRSLPRDYNRRERGGYQDRDREDYRSPRDQYSSRSRSHSHSTRARSRSRSPSPDYGGRPSREVILEGLPQGVTEEAIKEQLKFVTDVDKLEDVRVIRDRRTGMSRQFGFLRFPNVLCATAFLDENHPDVILYDPSLAEEDRRGVNVRIAFSREREDRDKQPVAGDWTCKACTMLNYSHRIVCFRCHAPRPESSAVAGQTQTFVNNGDNDAAPDTAPSQFLLVRGLDLSTSEEVFAKGMAKLYKGVDTSLNAQSKKPSKVISTTSIANLGAQEGSIKRVLIVKDKRSHESWRFGFAEFHSVDDAQAAVTKYNASDKFTISSKHIILSYVHTGVFVPVFQPTITQFSIPASGNPSLRVAYWDENAYVSELIVSEAPRASAPRDAKAGSKRIATALHQEGFAGAVDENATSKKRRVEAEKTGDKKKMTMPSHLQFWSDRHAELHGSEGNKSSEQKIDPQTQPAASKNQSSREKEEPAASGKEEPAVVSQSYADPKNNCCYLCGRQFTSIDHVNMHERLSEMHLNNLKDEEVKARAVNRLAAAERLRSQGITIGKEVGIHVPSTAAEPAAEYRDRAEERRQAYNQPKKPQTTSTNSSSKTKLASLESDAPASTPSKGASLLGKMGWSAGEGLGSQGTGMTAPIATDLYAPGVGLGAAGGKVGDAAEEALRSTKGDYKGFMQKTKDKAKERYENMG